MSSPASIPETPARQPTYPIPRRILRGSRRFDPPSRVGARQIVVVKVLSAAAIKAAHLGRYYPLDKTGTTVVDDRPFSVDPGWRHGQGRVWAVGHQSEVGVEVVLGGALRSEGMRGYADRYRGECDLYASSWLERQSGHWLQHTFAGGEMTYIRRGVDTELADDLELPTLPVGPLM